MTARYKAVIALMLAFAGLSLGAFAGPEWQVYFSPTDNCTAAITNELGKATNEVLVQAYSFTSEPIANALVAAHERGVMVTVILDKVQKTARKSKVDFVFHAGITTLIDAIHDKAHNKVVIVDGLVVITGSFNFSKAAEKRNAENLLIVRDKELAGQYISNWHLHKAHSAVYQGK